MVRSFNRQKRRLLAGKLIVIRRPSFVPLTLLGMLLLRLSLWTGLCIMVAQTTLAWISWRGLGGKLPFDLGDDTPVSCPSVSVERRLAASTVAHRCHRTNSAMRRPSFVPMMFLCELPFLVPFFSLGLLVVLC